MTDSIVRLAEQLSQNKEWMVSFAKSQLGRAEKQKREQEEEYRIADLKLIYEELLIESQILEGADDDSEVICGHATQKNLTSFARLAFLWTLASGC